MSDSPRRKRKTILFFVFAFILVIIVAAYIADRKAASNGLLVTISKETTYITEPLRPDGYPDYVAALNQRFSEGVTPENNSAVLFLKAFGPKMIADNYPSKYYEMLGIPPLPEHGDYFINSDDHLELCLALHPVEERPTSDLPEEGPLVPNNEDELRLLLLDQLDMASQRPWSMQEFPVWAEWLAANEKPLAVLVEASKRPMRYDPLICEEDGTALSFVFPAVFQHQDVSRALSARAMMQIYEGNVEQAREDLLACHRLARLAGQGPCLVETLVAISIDFWACNGDWALLEHGNLTSVQIERLRQDLDQLSAMPSIAEKLDKHERLSPLDVLTAFARGRVEPSLDMETIGDIVKFLPKHMVDWDHGLRLTNSLMDQAVEACRQPTQKARRTACDKYEHNLKQLVDELQSNSMLLFSPRKVAAQRLVVILLPQFSAARNAEDIATMRFETVKLAFALAAYRADHGTYPEKLEELVPKYAEAIQKDIFNDDADLYYSQKDGGYLLYSIGSNGVDDGGKGVYDCKASEGWDDIGARITGKDTPQ